MKKKLPFRLGTTSYILHDDILPNVHFLKDQVDSIELLLFESDETSNYPSKDVLKELNSIAADHNLTYTVHLPIRVPLGIRDEIRRKKNVAIMLRAMEATSALNPHTWELHLEPDEENRVRPVYDLEAWRACNFQSLEEIKAAGADPNRIAIEVLDYDFSLAEPVVDQAGFAICLDIGHVWHRKHNESYFLETILPKARTFHLHGFNQERDHKGIHHLPVEQVRRFIHAVAEQPDAHNRIVTLEVFSEQNFNSSMEVLNELF